MEKKDISTLSEITQYYLGKKFLIEFQDTAKKGSRHF